jgi:hypothetical protein
MKILSWYLTTNNYVKWQLGSVVCVEQPLLWAMFEWFVDEVLPLPAYPLRYIKMPSSINVKRCGDVYTMREWYGDLSQIYWSHVFDPIAQYYWETAPKHGRREYHVETGYTKLAELFKGHCEFEPVFGDEDDGGDDTE